MIGNEWTFWEYVFFSLVIFVAGGLDFVLQNWIIFVVIISGFLIWRLLK